MQQNLTHLVSLTQIRTWIMDLHPISWHPWSTLISSRSFITNQVSNHLHPHSRTFDCSIKLAFSLDQICASPNQGCTSYLLVLWGFWFMMEILCFLSLKSASKESSSFSETCVLIKSELIQAVKPLGASLKKEKIRLGVQEQFF